MQSCSLISGLKSLGVQALIGFSSALLLTSPVFGGDGTTEISYPIEVIEAWGRYTLDSSNINKMMGGFPLSDLLSAEEVAQIQADVANIRRGFDIPGPFTRPSDGTQTFFRGARIPDLSVGESFPIDRAWGVSPDSSVGETFTYRGRVLAEIEVPHGTVMANLGDQYYGTKIAGFIDGNENEFLIRPGSSFTILDRSPDGTVKLRLNKQTPGFSYVQASERGALERRLAQQQRSAMQWRNAIENELRARGPGVRIGVDGSSRVDTGVAGMTYGLAAQTFYSEMSQRMIPDPVERRAAETEMVRKYGGSGAAELYRDYNRFNESLQDNAPKLREQFEGGGGGVTGAIYRNLTKPIGNFIRNCFE